MAYPVIHRDETGAFIVPQPSGSITCNKHPASGGGWCEDIEWALGRRLDASDVWEHGMSVDPWLPHVTVPIMPSKQLWAIVRLHKLDNNLLRAVKTEPHRRDSGELQSLGFISKGEGRMILREMILDWFQEFLDIDKHRCRSIEHTARKTMLVSQDCNSSSVAVFINCWTMYHFDECEYCWAAGRSSGRRAVPAFDPDLIPPSV